MIHPQLYVCLFSKTKISATMKEWANNAHPKTPLKLCLGEMGGGERSLQKENQSDPSHSVHLNTLECISGLQKAPYLEDSLSGTHLTCTYQGRILTSQREDISVVWAGNLKLNGGTWRWRGKKTLGHHISLMGLGNQWCGRVTARSPSHSTPWASPALTQSSALGLIDGGPYRVEAVHGVLGSQPGQLESWLPWLTFPKLPLIHWYNEETDNNSTS